MISVIFVKNLDLKQSLFIFPLLSVFTAFSQNNKYAKMEIIYFYDTLNPDTGIGDIGGFYTFNYVYQSEEGNTAF